MGPEELRDMFRQKPFEPFRIALSDGVSYAIRLAFRGRPSQVPHTNTKHTWRRQCYCTFRLTPDSFDR